MGIRVAAWRLVKQQVACGHFCNNIAHCHVCGCPLLDAVLNATGGLAMLTLSKGALQSEGGSVKDGGDLGRNIAQADAMPDCPQSWVSHLKSSLGCCWSLQLSMEIVLTAPIFSNWADMQMMYMCSCQKTHSSKCSGTMAFV